MKTILIAAGALILVLTGCDSPPTKQEPTVTPVHCWSYYVTVIDGCEYIGIFREITHKGNCTNAIHSYNVERK